MHVKNVTWTLSMGADSYTGNILSNSFFTGIYLYLNETRYHLCHIQWYVIFNRVSSCDVEAEYYRMNDQTETETNNGSL